MVTITCVDCGTQCDRASKQALRCFPCSASRQRAIGRQSMERRKAGIPPRKKVAIDQRWQAFGQRAVAFAKAMGVLPSLEDCLTACVDCGGIATCYDHRDYSRPLDVAPVCVGCNNRRGPGAIPAPRIEQPKAHAA